MCNGQISNHFNGQIESHRLQSQSSNTQQPVNGMKILPIDTHVNDTKQWLIRLVIDCEPRNKKMLLQKCKKLHVVGKERYNLWTIVHFDCLRGSILFKRTIEVHNIIQNIWGSNNIIEVEIAVDLILLPNNKSQMKALVLLLIP